MKLLYAPYFINAFSITNIKILHISYSIFLYKIAARRRQQNIPKRQNVALITLYFCLKNLYFWDSENRLPSQNFRVTIYHWIKKHITNHDLPGNDMSLDRLYWGYHLGTLSLFLSHYIEFKDRADARRWLIRIPDLEMRFNDITKWQRTDPSMDR